ncbi:hypothetical protein GF407_19545 [candidate division KSB1 bacterium]|nr:hypothetical protein [candidate division KSB1 bacterium]
MRTLVILFIYFVFLASFLSAQPAEQMFVMELGDNWQVDKDLPKHALLISLQGIANRGAPRLYFIYPHDWDFKFSRPLMQYYMDSRGMAFNNLKSVEDALVALSAFAKGYVVWDSSVRTSLIVAFTAAGLKEALVVTGDLIPLVEKYGLEKVEDFRGKFTGMSDEEIYNWAYDQYWDQTSRDYLIYMGGHYGNVMKPGIADFGIHQKAFFTDASTNPEDTLEYQFARKVFSEMKPLSMVMGWHSYGKDTEAQHVTLASSYALRIEGLHTLPNMSFNHQIPLSRGYKFKNNHNVNNREQYVPGKKVYIACIQTDCLGLGAWTEPGRGEIPYAWEVTMNWSWLAPAMLQFFYDMATPNDYFIGSLSGPGYMYPKAIPQRYLPQVVDKAYEMMKTLDLNVFETMDHANYWQSDAVDDDLTEKVVNTYFERMPGAIGFANGYRPAHTFAVQEGRPFMSFDYYLSETRKVDEAVADLEELANLNSERPYFLLMHVREWSDIKRVKSILDKLSAQFELVPLDVFMKMAGNQPTFVTRYAEEWD